MDSSYGSPVTPVSNSYGAPVEDSYTAPQAPVAPGNSYGSPKAPSNSYGAPKVPTNSYGAPASPANNDYGVPLDDPSIETYGSQVISLNENSYTAPVTPASNSYGSSVNFNFAAPSAVDNGYGAPQFGAAGSSYAAPVADGYGSPQAGSPAGSSYVSPVSNTYAAPGSTSTGKYRKLKQIYLFMGSLKISLNLLKS